MKERPPDPYTMQDLEVALEESVKLQSHYAKLLNGWDFGKRMTFKTGQEWIDRLRETGKLRPLP